MKQDSKRKAKAHQTTVKGKVGKVATANVPQKGSGMFSVNLMVALLLTVVVGIHALLVYVYNFNFDHYTIADRDWGYDNIRYMPLYVQVMFYVISLAAIWGIFIIKAGKKVRKLVADHRLPAITTAIITLLLLPLSYLFFKSFKIKYSFLGDMNLRVAQTLNKEFFNTEYLTMRGLHFLHSKLGEKYSMSMEDIFIQTGFASGALFVACAFLASAVMFRNSFHRLLSFLFIASGGYLLIFCGYLEIYALPALFIMIFLLVGLLALTNRIHYIFAIAAYVLAVGFHGFSLIFLPALFYILYKKTPLQKVPLGKIPRWAYLLGGLAAIASFYVLGPLFKFSFFLPVADAVGNKKMLLFSTTHFWECMNALVLGGGGSFILLIVSFFTSILWRDRSDRVSNFLMLATFFSVGFVFLLDAMRGSGDWDLFAIAMIPSNMLVPYHLLNGQNFFSKRAVYMMLAAGLTFNIFNTMSWLKINNNEQSISKIKQMLINDPGSYYVNSLQSEPGLALSFKSNGLMEEAFKMHEISFRKYGNICGKCVYNYGSDLTRYGNKEKGAEILEHVVATFPYYPYSYLALLNHYGELEDVENNFRIANIMFSNYRKNSTEFDKYIKKADLVKIFSNLYNFEQYQGNTARCLEISAVLSKLNASQ